MNRRETLEGVDGKGVKSQMGKSWKWTSLFHLVCAALGSILDSSQLPGEALRFQPVFQAELGKNALGVLVDRAGADTENGRNLRVGLGFRNPEKHLPLALGKAQGARRCRLDAKALAHHRNDKGTVLGICAIDDEPKSRHRMGLQLGKTRTYG